MKTMNGKRDRIAICSLLAKRVNDVAQCGTFVIIDSRGGFYYDKYAPCLLLHSVRIV